MLNTRGVSSFNDFKKYNNTRILVRKTCILLYFIHGPPVFSILDVLCSLRADPSQPDPCVLFLSLFVLQQKRLLANVYG